MITKKISKQNRYYTVCEMENLSVEILDIIFEYIPSLNDIQNCVKTCTKWNKIIRRKFQNKGSYLNSNQNYNYN